MHSHNRPRRLPQLFNEVIKQLVANSMPLGVHIFETGLIPSLLLKWNTPAGPTGKKWGKPAHHFGTMTLEKIKQVLRQLKLLFTLRF